MSSDFGIEDYTQRPTRLMRELLDMERDLDGVRATLRDVIAYVDREGL